MNIQKMIENLAFKYGSNNQKIKIAKRWGVNIGKNCRLFNINFGSEPYLIQIGNHCEITAGVRFITHDGGTWIFRENKKFLGSKFGPIIIHDNCFIGVDSIILPDVEIGPNSIIGAGSVVTKNIPANSIYAGNPAHFISSVDDYLNKCKNNNQGDTGCNEHRSVVQKKKIVELFEKKLNK